MIDEKRVENGTISLKIFAHIISAFRNNVAKLHYLQCTVQKKLIVMY
jgi:hypothetical protein